MLLGGAAAEDRNVGAQRSGEFHGETSESVPTGGVDGINALIVAIRSVIATSRDGDDTGWRRFVRIHLAGLGTDR